MTAVKQISLVTEAEYLESELDAEVRHEFLGGYATPWRGRRRFTIGLPGLGADSFMPSCVANLASRSIRT